MAKIITLLFLNHFNRFFSNHPQAPLKTSSPKTASCNAGSCTSAERISPVSPLPSSSPAPPTHSLASSCPPSTVESSPGTNCSKIWSFPLPRTLSSTLSHPLRAGSTFWGCGRVWASAVQCQKIGSGGQARAVQIRFFSCSDSCAVPMRQYHCWWWQWTWPGTFGNLPFSWAHTFNHWWPLRYWAGGFDCAWTGFGFWAGWVLSNKKVT